MQFILTLGRMHLTNIFYAVKITSCY